jgi:hypothetical protein
MDIDMEHGIAVRVFALGCLLLGFSLLGSGPSCTTPPPQGEAIDFEVVREFKPFRLKSLQGETKILDEFLDRLTLVSFFFPT